ncbi:MAG: hypothetical protein EXQ85_04730 [Alphaproteobacteria bacterium]|nr:hypothetical protein [Alphaproteobacteria bacterium]
MPSARRHLEDRQRVSEPAPHDQAAFRGQPRRVLTGGAVLLALLVLVAGQPAKADFDDGLKAYEGGDFVTAFNEWLPLARNGDTAAQRNVGHLYRLGRGVPPDFQVAANWYRRAAIGGLTRAAGNLADMYLRGQGVPQNAKKAAAWFFRAAVDGHAIAQFNLALMYERGLGVKQSDQRAAGWYQLAGEARSPRALELFANFAERNVTPMAIEELRDDQDLADPRLYEEDAADEIAAATPPAAARGRPPAANAPARPGPRATPSETEAAAGDADKGDAAAPPNQRTAAADRATQPPRSPVSPNRDDDDDDPFANRDGEGSSPPAATQRTPPAPSEAARNQQTARTPKATATAEPPAPAREDESADRLSVEDENDAVPPAAAAQPPPPPATAAPPAPARVASAPAAQPNDAALVNEGLEAYRRKYFKAALEVWLPLAKAGNADAQFYVGGLYMDGSGVAEDVIQAHTWWLLSSDQGHVRAKEFLGLVKSVMDQDQIKRSEELVSQLRPVRRN